MLPLSSALPSSLHYSNIFRQRHFPALLPVTFQLRSSACCQTVFRSYSGALSGDSPIPGVGALPSGIFTENSMLPPATAQLRLPARRQLLRQFLPEPIEPPSPYRSKTLHSWRQSKCCRVQIQKDLERPSFHAPPRTPKRICPLVHSLPRASTYVEYLWFSLC